MIKNLIFDLGGVIIPIDKEVAISRFEALGDSDARLKMGDYGQTDIYLGVENGSLTAAEFCERFAAMSGKPCTFEQAQWAWLGFMKKVPVRNLRRLSALREKYKVYLLSNTNPFIMAWARSGRFSDDGLPLDHYFDKMYCSYEMRDYKPSPTIFESALRDAGVEAGETLFIDDSERNVNAAGSLGIRTLLMGEGVDWADESFSFDLDA